MMAKPWIKLDLDFEDDPKVMDYFDRHGERDYKSIIRLFLALGEFDGRIEYRDNNGHRLKFRKRMHMTDKQAEAFIGRCMEVGLVDPDGWREFGVIANGRAIKDGDARRSRRESAVNAGAISGERRRARRDSERDVMQTVQRGVERDVERMPNATGEPYKKRKEKKREIDQERDTARDRQRGIPTVSGRASGVPA